MKSDLLLAVENALDEEANRIAIEITNLNHSQKKVYTSYDDLVRRFLKKEYEYYFVEIELRTYKFLSNNVVSNKCALANGLQATVLHLYKYSEYSLKNEHKDHKMAAKEMANILIDYSKYHPDSKKGLLELASSNMNYLFPAHNDSVDSRAMILYLQNELEKKGYIVISLNPFRIKKVYLLGR